MAAAAAKEEANKARIARDIAAEKVRTDALIAEAQRKSAEEARVKAEERARRKELEAQYREEDKELKSVQFEEDLEINRERDAIIKAEKDNKIVEDRTREAGFRAEKVKTEKRHGKTTAGIEDKFRRLAASSEVKDFNERANKLSFLKNMKSKKAQKAAKALQITSILINAPSAAFNAYMSMSTIPLVGPALGAVAAAASLVYSSEQISKIRAARQGGQMRGMGGRYDNQLAMLNKNEIVIPEPIVPNFVQQFGRLDQREGSDSDDAIKKVEIGFTDEASNYISEQQREAGALSIAGAN